MPIDSIPYKNRATHWVKPFLVAEIKFNSWTKDNIMRAAIFLRFREDKDPVECIVEANQPVASTLDMVQNKIPHNNNKYSSKKIVLQCN